MDYEEFFIKMIYNAALEYLDLPQEEKCKIIKKYFEANFKRE
jgi:hypothetical protein